MRNAGIKVRFLRLLSLINPFKRKSQSKIAYFFGDMTKRLEVCICLFGYQLLEEEKTRLSSSSFMKQHLPLSLLFTSEWHCSANRPFLAAKHKTAERQKICVALSLVVELWTKFRWLTERQKTRR